MVTAVVVITISTPVDAIATPINLNDFSVFDPGDPVVIAGDGSSATISEALDLFSVLLFNDPLFIGNPEVIIAGPGVFLRFEFDFSEPAGNVDEFFTVVFDSATGTSLGAAFEFFADSTRAD